jgi:outer membrane assembly lipoprotein YfiO
MKRKIATSILVLGLAAAVFSDCANAYWIWTPGSKKFINPKYAAKDTPKEQFDWAMGFFEQKDYKRAVAEFEKLVRYYEFSEYAAKAQYYVGLCYEKMDKYYYAFQNYQKVVDYYPHSEDLETIIRKEFELGNLYLEQDNPNIMGMNLITKLDRAIEIFKKVVEDAPYGELADKAQFKLGEAYKKAERYDEAIGAFQKLVDDYQNSPLVDRAKYEVAYCAYKASLAPAYDQQPTDKALAAFERFSEEATDKALTEEADETLRRLKDRAAEKSFEIASFYERQKKYAGAVTYYEEVVKKYPNSSFAEKARKKIEELTKRIKKR